MYSTSFLALHQSLDLKTAIADREHWKIHIASETPGSYVCSLMHTTNLKIILVTDLPVMCIASFSHGWMKRNGSLVSKGHNNIVIIYCTCKTLLTGAVLYIERVRNYKQFREVGTIVSKITRLSPQNRAFSAEIAPRVHRESKSMLFITFCFGRCQTPSRMFCAKTTTRGRRFNAYVISHSTCLFKVVCIRNQTSLMFQQTAQNAKANVLEGGKKRNNKCCKLVQLVCTKYGNLIRKLTKAKLFRKAFKAM